MGWAGGRGSTPAVAKRVAERAPKWESSASYIENDGQNSERDDIAQQRYMEHRSQGDQQTADKGPYQSATSGIVLHGQQRSQNRHRRECLGPG